MNIALTIRKLAANVNLGMIYAVFENYQDT